MHFFGRISNPQNLLSEHNKETQNAMTVNKKKIGIAAVAVALVGVAGIAIAKSDDHRRDGRHYGGQFGFGGNISRLSSALDLNDDQREQARVLMNDIREFRRQHRETARLAVASAFTQDSLSPTEGQKLLSMRQQHRDAMRAFMGAKLSEFHGILTPAQRENAVALWQDRRGKFGGRGNDRRGGWGWGRGHHDDDDDHYHRRRHRDYD